MVKAAPEHFEMAATAFTSTGRPIDSALCEKFADILARESAGHSAVLQKNLELKNRVETLYGPRNFFSRYCA